MRLGAVQRHAVEGRREAFGVVVLREEMETRVGTARAALARELTLRVLALAPEREHAGRVRKLAGHVFLQYVTKSVCLAREIRKRDFRELLMGERLKGRFDLDGLV